MRFLISDYYATGEGYNISILITSNIDPFKSFENLFGEYYALGAYELSKEAFITNHIQNLPLYISESLKKDEIFEYFSQFHINYA